MGAGHSEINPNFPGHSVLGDYLTEIVLGRAVKAAGKEKMPTVSSSHQTLRATILTCLARCATGVVEVRQLGEQPHAFLFVKPDPRRDFTPDTMDPIKSP